MSVRTGIMVAATCVIFYAASFLQMLLPISAAMKGILWFIFFGLAKTAQYTALLILGKEGFRALWRRLRRQS